MNKSKSLEEKNNFFIKCQEIKSVCSTLKLLYVEDNRDARIKTNLLLKEFFKDITIGVDGEDGLDKFRNNDIDIIITDISMPKLNGLTMATKIKATHPDIPIIILSANNESDYFLKSIQLGIDGYLLKPIELNPLLSTLGKIVDVFKYKYEAKETLNLLLQYQTAVDNTLIVTKTDINGNITYANDKFCEISQYSKEELIGKNHNIVRHPDNPSSIYYELWKTIKDEKKIWQGVIKDITKTKENYYVQSTIVPIMDNHGEVLEYMALRNDITAIMNQKKQLSDFIHFAKEPMVALLKIANFEDIENMYGEDNANLIEESFALQIHNIIPKDYPFKKLFTLSNGEYALVQDKIDCIMEEEEIIQNLLKLQKSISKKLFSTMDLEYEISLLISFAYGQNSLENSRIGLKRVLEKKEDFIIANNFMQEEQRYATKNIATVKMIKNAIEQKKIISFFQPIINNKTKEIEKYESLVRLIDDDNEIISPENFLETSKKGIYYSKITAIVLENSFKLLTSIDKSVTINLSVLDIEKDSIRNQIFDFLESHRTDAKRIVFELLEEDDIKDFKIIKSFILSVKSFGAKIAIDDFGTGYSNFKRLLDYQPDILKIDGSLIKNIENDKFLFGVVKSILTFAKEEKIKTVAEYVENESIYNILCQLGVDYSQGYYFGKPEDITNILKERN
jgi:PAS domain S-box-containing protein